MMYAASSGIASPERGNACADVTGRMDHESACYPLLSCRYMDRKEE